MKLLEMFILLELRDRLAHTAETMTKKIAKRWDDKVNDGGMTGLPDEWRQALSDDILPDGMTMSRHDNWPEIYGEKMAQWIVEWFSEADPTKNKKYTDWILRQWLSDTLWLEDVAKIPGILATFEEHRKKLPKMDIQGRDGEPLGPPPQRRSDINAWKDYRDLAYAVRPLTGERAAGEKVSNMLAKPDIQAMMHHPVPDPQKAFGPEGEWDLDEIRSAYAGETGEDGGQFDTMDWYDFEQADADIDTTAIEKVYADDKIAVLIPNSRAAACELGKGTEWCTAATSSDNYFWNYAPEGPMYVIITDKHGKFQFHFETGQFANVHDEMLNDNEKMKLVQEYPQLRRVFANQAEQFGEIWLMDPQALDKEWVDDAIRRSEGFFDSDNDVGETLQKLPKSAIVDQMPEDAVAEIENWIRHKDPLEAWRKIRNPTEEDLQAALHAEDNSTRGYNPATGIMDYATKNGIELRDETIETAVARDGEALMYLPPEKMRQHPNWILAAVQDQPRVLEYAIDTIIHQKPVWGDMADEHDEARYQAIVDTVREHPDVATNVARIEPSLARHMRDWFGTDPWLVAIKNAGSHKGSIETLAQDIRVNDMQLDYEKILKFLIDNDAPYIEYVQAIEEQVGELPLWFQKALVEKSWDNLDIMNNPHPELVKAMQARNAPEQARQEQIRQGGEAWKAERAALRGGQQ